MLHLRAYFGGFNSYSSHINIIAGPIFGEAVVQGLIKFESICDEFFKSNLKVHFWNPCCHFSKSILRNGLMIQIFGQWLTWVQLHHYIDQYIV